MRGTGSEEDRVVEEILKVLEKAWSGEGEDVTLEQLIAQAGARGDWAPRRLLKLSARVAIARIAMDPELRAELRRAAEKFLQRLRDELGGPRAH